MQRKLLAATVAAGPLLALALAAPHAALAQTTINTATTAPVATATAANGAPSDVVLDSAGTITVSAPGPAITLNSNNNVTVSGVISTRDINDSTGVLAVGGNSGNVTVGSNINLLSDYEPKDNDNDGDADGAFATGSNRVGVRVTGPAPFTGNISLIGGGAIAAVGADSAGVLIGTNLNGAITINGSVTTVGDRVYGVRSTGQVTGPVRIAGAISTTGADSVGVALDGDLGSSLVFQGTVTTTGFRYTTRPPLSTQRAILDADDKLLGGPAVRIAGNVAGGVLFDIPPTNIDLTDANNDGVYDNPDVDGDGLPDATEGSTTITAFGSAPAVVIGNASRATTIGQVAGSAYGIDNRGTITSDGVLDGFAATAMQIGVGQPVTIAGGISNSGSIAASSYVANSTGLLLGSGVSTPTLNNSGSIVSATTTDQANTNRGVSIQAGASVGSLVNSGTISSAVTGSKGDAIAFEDLGGKVLSVQNTGKITAAVVGEAGVKTTGRNIALDLRAATGDVTVTQSRGPTSIAASGSAPVRSASSAASAASSATTQPLRRCSMRSTISAAAALVNVRHRMPSGSAPESSSRSTRSVSTRVLPVPALAVTHTERPGSAAAFCAGVGPLIPRPQHPAIPRRGPDGRSPNGPVRSRAVAPADRPSPGRRNARSAARRRWPPRRSGAADRCHREPLRHPVRPRCP